MALTTDRSSLAPPAPFDRTALKVNQAAIVALLVAERLVILLALAALIAAVWAIVGWRQRRQLATLVAQRPFAGILPVSGPAIVAFTLPTCGECRARQAPALERLREQVGDKVTITTLAADRHGELLKHLGIMTVPATAVLDADGAVRAINQGFADEARLWQQLALAMESSLEPPTRE